MLEACSVYDTGFFIPVAHATLLGPEVSRISLLTMYGNTTMKDTELGVAFSDWGDATAPGRGKQLYTSATVFMRCEEHIGKA